MNPYASLLRNGNFTKLWGSQILSQIAQNLLFFALIIRVFDLASGTHFANVSVALLVLAFGIPAIIFGPLAGVYVDYWNRKWVLVAVNFIRALLVLLFVFVEHNLYIVLAIAFAISTSSQFFIPAESAAIPVLVEKPMLVAANALFVFTLYGSFVVGYGSSAFAIKIFGDEGPYILTSVLWVLAALADLLLPTMKAIRIRHRLTLREEVKRVWGEISSNLDTIRKSHRLYFPIMQLTITQSVVGIVLALAPALSLALLRTKLTNSSHVLLIPAGIGLVAGVILINSLIVKYSTARVVAISMLIASLGLTALGLAGQIYRIHSASINSVSTIVAILVFSLGLFNAMISAAAQTMLQEATTDQTRGKVFGALGMMINIAATLPVFFAGILADVFTVTKVLSVLGFGLTLFALWQLLRLRKRHYLIR
jgi:MFS family permease